jgi:hypothetical protein
VTVEEVAEVGRAFRRAKTAIRIKEVSPKRQGNTLSTSIIHVDKVQICFENLMKSKMQRRAQDANSTYRPGKLIELYSLRSLAAG